MDSQYVRDSKNLKLLTSMEESLMPLLKAYANLDLRPSGVDSLGRLTTEDERRIMSSFKTVYGEDHTDVKLHRMDLALARGRRIRPYELVTTVKAKELPATSRHDDPEMVVGCLVGSLATPQDLTGVKNFASLKPTASIRGRMNSVLDESPSVLMVTGFVNMSRYRNPSMLAFLLRKVQASSFGQIPVIVLWPSVKMEKQLNEQFIHYGFKPYGIGSSESISDPLVKANRCIAMWTRKPEDDRENRKK